MRPLDLFSIVFSYSCAFKGFEAPNLACGGLGKVSTEDLIPPALCWERAVSYGTYILYAPFFVIGPLRLHRISRGMQLF